MPDPAPTVTVVVPVRDDAAALSRCLAAVGEQRYPRDRVQVVVADSASSPPLALADPDVVVVRADQPGSYRARNLAVRHAEGEVLAFTDADCLPTPDWLAHGVARLQAGADVVGGGVEVFARDPARPTAVELFEVAFAFPQAYWIAEHDFAVTANLLTWRHTWDAVGPFDDSLHSGGDVDWCRRAVAAGLLLAHEPTAVVRHPARRTFAELVRRRRRTMRGTARLAADGRLGWAPGVRMYLRPDRDRLARIQRLDHLSGRDRVRMAAAATAEDLAAAWELATSYRQRRRGTPP